MYNISIQVEGLMVKQHGYMGTDIEKGCDEYGGDRGYDFDGESGRKKNLWLTWNSWNKIHKVDSYLIRIKVVNTYPKKNLRLSMSDLSLYPEILWNINSSFPSQLCTCSRSLSKSRIYDARILLKPIDVYDIINLNLLSAKNFKFIYLFMSTAC